MCPLAYKQKRLLLEKIFIVSRRIHYTGIYYSRITEINKGDKVIRKIACTELACPERSRRVEVSNLSDIFWLEIT